MGCESRPDNSCRITRHDCIRGDIARHHRTGSDDGTSADANAAQQDRAEANPNILLDVDLKPEALSAIVWCADPRGPSDRYAHCPKIMVVAPDHANVVSDHHVVADRSITLDCGHLADVYVVPNLHSLRGPYDGTEPDVELATKIHVRPNAVHPVDRLPQFLKQRGHVSLDDVRAGRHEHQWRNSQPCSPLCRANVPRGILASAA